MTIECVAQELRDYQLTLRIPRRIHAAIKAQAESDRRSVADVINNTLEKLYPAPSLKQRTRGR